MSQCKSSVTFVNYRLNFQTMNSFKPPLKFRDKNEGNHTDNREKKKKKVKDGPKKKDKPCKCLLIYP